MKSGSGGGAFVGGRTHAKEGGGPQRGHKCWAVMSRQWNGQECVACNRIPSPIERPRGHNSPRGRTAYERTDLVAPNLLSYVVESFYYTEPELLSLLIFVDDDIFDMAHQAEIVYAVRNGQISACQLTAPRPPLTISSPPSHILSPPPSPPHHTPPVCSIRPPA